MCDAISEGLHSVRKTLCMCVEKWLFLSNRPPLPLTALSGMSDDGGKEAMSGLTTMVSFKASLQTVRDVSVPLSLWYV